MKKHYYIIIFLLVLFDQISKYVFFDLRFMEDNYFITPLVNTGISWGIELFPMDLLIFVTIAIISFIVFLYRKKYIWNIEFILIFSGAMWNLIDRVYLQWVRDFADVHFWPVFNMADAYISIWFLFIVYYTYIMPFFWKKDEKNKEKKK